MLRTLCSAMVCFWPLCVDVAPKPFLTWVSVPAERLNTVWLVSGPALVKVADTVSSSDPLIQCTLA